MRPNVGGASDHVWGEPATQDWAETDRLHGAFVMRFPDPYFSRGPWNSRRLVKMGDGVAQDEWIYERAADGSARFVLGTVGENPLMCFGINPSTAVPNAPDRTVARVSRFAADNEYDSWTMLNVYPQIATDPKQLHLTHSPDLKAENERHIARLIDGRPLTLVGCLGAGSSHPGPISRRSLKTSCS